MSKYLFSEKSKWDGRYFVTLRLSNGETRRQDATRRMPKNATVIATDNGIKD